MTQAAKLSQIRQRVANAPSGWLVNYGDASIELKACPPVNMGDDPFPVTYATLNLDDWDTANFLLSAHADMIFLIAMVDRAIARFKSGNHTGCDAQSTSAQARQSRNSREQEPSKNKDYAAQCAIACTKPAFKKFLQENHRLGKATNEATAAKVRELLGIASRAQLNKEQSAAARWLKLNRDFTLWLRSPCVDEGV